MTDERDKNYKKSSARIISDLLSEEGVKKVRDYVSSEEFKTERDRIRQSAARRLKDIKDRYKSRSRTPEEAAREKDLTLRLAEVEAEAAELRIRLSELLEEERKLREELQGF